MSDMDLKSYTDTVYHNEELKSLTRYRFDKVRGTTKLKQSSLCLVTILFPELEKLVLSLQPGLCLRTSSANFLAPNRFPARITTHLKAVLKTLRC